MSLPIFHGTGDLIGFTTWIFGELPAVKVTGETFARYTSKAYAQRLGKQRVNKTA